MNEKKELGKLKRVNPIIIKPSEENPRGDDFYKNKNFLRLKESVAKYGVIVPIIIKRLLREEDKSKYQLIDGERRWRAAVETNQDRVPAYVLPPEKQIDILATMFQIHMNQEGWDAIEQARALEKIIYNLKTTIKQKYKDEEAEKELVRQLIKVTGMDENNAWSRVRFFRWPQRLRDQIYRETEKDYYSYAVEIEARIVEPTLRNFPDIKEKISPDDIREALFAKVTGGSYVSRAEEIRDAAILAKRRSDKKEVTKAKGLLLQFIKDKSFSFSEAHEQYLYLFPEEAQKPALSPRKLINTVRGLTKALKEYTEGTIIRKLKPTQKKDLKTALKELLLMMQDIIQRLK